MEKVIQERKKVFWGQECFHDVSFTFADSMEIKANRMILALCSPVFEKMFYGHLPEKRNAIPIDDIDSDVFLVFLKYIYTGEFETDNLEVAKYLFYAAHKYGITTMEAACEQYIVKNIKTFDLTEVVMFAEKLSMQNLVDLCRLYIQHKPRTHLWSRWEWYTKGDPIPQELRFVDIDKNGWPIGIGRVKKYSLNSTEYFPGTLYIKDMKLRVAYHSRSHEYDDGFEVLCNGNLEWKPNENRREFLDYEDLYIGKTNIDGNAYIGRVDNLGLYIPFQNVEYKVEKYLKLVDIIRLNPDQFEWGYHRIQDDDGTIRFEKHCFYDRANAI